MKICSIEGCGREAKGRRMCSSHYYRVKKFGDPLAGSTPKNGAPLRHLNEVVLTYSGDDCLKWPFATSRSGGGYGKLYFGGRLQTVSRIVCEKVNGPPPTPWHQAAHNCGRGHEGCVNPRHMRWATRTENMADKVAHGTGVRGEAHKLAKLSEADVRQILALKGKMLQREIGQMFGVRANTVSVIQSGRKWAHLQKTDAS
jgi:hypothetical protein